MKKIKYVIIFLFMFMLTTNVNAEARLTARLECSDTVKLNSSIVCNIKADIDGGSISELKANKCITLPGKQTCDIESYSTFNSDLKETGNNITIGTIEVKKDLITKPGNLTISFQFTSGTSNTGDVVFTESIINKEIKVLNNDATLNNLTIDSTSVIDSLDKEHVYNKETVEINGVLNDKNASIKSGTGKIDLKCGKNTYNVVTLAEDKTASKTYKLLINRTCDESATLKEIKLSSGSLNPTFNSSTVNYAISVSKDIDKLTITPVPTSDKSTFKINNSDSNEVALEYGDNEVKIEVTSENGSKGVYTLTINREDSRDNNNYLSDIELSSGKILFDKETLSYNVKVLYDVTTIDVTAKAEKETSKVEVTKDKTLKVGENLIIIKVTSEKGDTKEYSINVTRLKEGETLGDNPRIKDIVIEGYKLDFKSDVTSYTLKIDDEEELDITVYMEDETSTYTISDNENLKNKSVITINTLSEDGSTLTYKIFIEKSNSILLIIIVVICILLIGGISIFLILKNKNKNKKDDKKVTTNVVKEDKVLSKIDKQLESIKENDYDGNPVVKEATTVPVEEYKICPLCGHKISFESKICPYCKKNFSISTETL